MKTRRSTGGQARLWRRIALFSFLLGLAVAWIVIDHIISPMERNRTSVEIPDFRGMLAEEIVTEPWLEKKIEYRYDKTHVAGEVISQTPAGGSRRKLTDAAPTCTVTLVVSLGEESVTVPKLSGLDHREAQSELRRLGLTVELRHVTGAHPEGLVIASEPRAGEKVPIGSTVTLTVSAGTPNKTVTVPELRGLSREDALVRVWLSELSVKEVIEVESEEAGGVVIRQSHMPGTLVLAGTEITLYVSRDTEE